MQISVSSLLRVPFVKNVTFPRRFLFFNSGRGSIKWLVSHLKKNKEKDLYIGIPCYSCYTVYQSVYESGNKVILLDINP